MKTSIIEQAALRLITAKSKRFPEGNGAAFNALESELESLKGRRFYGLVYETEGQMEYYAGLVPNDEVEEDRFAKLGYPLMEIDAGQYARTKLMDWNDKLDRIGPIFGAMMAEHEIDPTRPQIEYYRSQNELQLLLPVNPK